jgi:hypothetical protein
MLQYYKVDQTLEDAAVLYPAPYRTHGVNLIPYGGFRTYLPLMLKHLGR